MTDCADSAQDDAERQAWFAQLDRDAATQRRRGPVDGMGRFFNPRYTKSVASDQPSKGDSHAEYARKRLWGNPAAVEDTPQTRRRRRIEGCANHKAFLALVEETYTESAGLPVPSRGWPALMKGLKLLKGEYSEIKAKELFLWTVGRMAGEGVPAVVAYCQKLAEMGKRRKALRYYESLPLVGDWTSGEDAVGG